MKKLLVVFCLLLFAQGALAREKMPDLQKGMTDAEVLTRAGGPNSKVIMEVKREERWMYTGYSVLLKDGYVISVDITDPALALAAGTPAAGAEAAQARKRTRETPPDLLRNILKELPASPAPGAAAPAPAGGGAPAAGMPLAPVPQPLGTDEE